MNYFIDTNWYRLPLNPEYNLLSVTGHETGNYNPDFCRNGGGYWQMEGSCFARVGSHLFFVETFDDSCGDFYTEQGVRVHICDDPIDDREYPVYCFSWDDEGRIGDPYEVIQNIWENLGVDVVDVIATSLAATYAVAYDEWWEENH